jgi:hypothetical protein
MAVEMRAANSDRTGTPRKNLETVEAPTSAAAATSITVGLDFISLPSYVYRREHTHDRFLPGSPELNV